MARTLHPLRELQERREGAEHREEQGREAQPARSEGGPSEERETVYLAESRGKYGAVEQGRFPESAQQWLNRIGRRIRKRRLGPRAGGSRRRGRRRIKNQKRVV